ncbi:MAG: excinuclease ABC subunit UvrC [Thermoanaerobaculaceae bacterium]
MSTMVARARGLEFVVTATEVEALILENRLIKQHRPRYNVLLRDDKTYPYVKLTTGEAWPRAHLTRRVQDDGHRHFGPFMGHSMAARIMDIIRTRTQVRTCALEIDGSLPRPCLYHAMGACLAPCVAGMTTPEAYAEAVEEVEWLLDGRHVELQPRLETQMWRASEADEFERAARYRDLLRALEGLRQGQHVELAGSGSVDVVGIEGDGRDLTVVVLVYREGRLVDKREFHWEGIDQALDGELVADFLAQYYDANPAVPERVEVPLLPDEPEAVGEYLQGLRGGKVAVVAPKRGRRARVAELAADNAREAFRLRFRHPRRDVERVGEAVAAALGLAVPVQRIECFDVSHLQGEDQVVSLVVWQGGRMVKGEFRSFNVRAGQGADDPAAIAEAVRRRYRRRLTEGQPLPDLVLVDGGSAQLDAARTALAGLGVDPPVAALAKKLEELYLAGRSEPLQLGSSHPARLLLQRVRDEAHRFAVTRHRRRRKARPARHPAPRRARRRPRPRPHAAGRLRLRRRCSGPPTSPELVAAVGKRAAAALWAVLHP